MESGQGTDSWIVYFQSHPFVVITVVAALAVLAYWKPKDAFKLMAVLLVIGAVGYVVSFLVNLTSTGVEEQRQFMSSPRGKVE
jgi:hypothetical protein